MQGNVTKVLYICFTMIPVIAAYFVKKKYTRLKELEKDKNEYYYQNIFIHSNYECRQHILKYTACGDQCSLNHLQTLVHFIASAKETISVCVLTLQLLNIFQELLKAHERGLKVRIILDREMIAVDSPQLEGLKNAGIAVTTQKADGSYLHHKFCLIDEKNKNSAKMFFGSMNFTMQGIVRNFEHITLTNDYKIIAEFSEEFEKLWNKFN